ncbi:polysaccharide deacetylase family protein [Crocosphaera chwakensis]|uniref:Glycoside hydrolase family 57 N-terminal domain-containing protein n=1 Tax=Crocosphaera chwakensis CCY0110 TaxID=391612 RepID=A3IIL0_9CHRO|nr:glycoside hydrolase family 57 [Crocosphaera chwakensis]EAZ93642.1 hypothetical protein CY0110_17642 [Crocosphaera chwakensis CCY0110]
MTQPLISHALGLHMHQPPGNLKLLIDHHESDAELIIRCYERAVRYAQQFKDSGNIHVGFSGILLEQFLDPEIIDRYRKFIDIPAMLESYRTAHNVELIGMGYYHPVFPLIPQEDWKEHLTRGRQIIEEVFGRAPKGFWPPEMAFCMEMIPAIADAGYEYVIVDGVHVQPDNKPVDIYQPYQATYEGSTITIIPRERDVSNAQESGMDAIWFTQEVQHKVKSSPNPEQPRLVTTWSDGENGGWFRQMSEESAFYGHFWSPLINKIKNGEVPIRSVSLSEYIKEHPPTESAFVRTGAWNVGTTSGFDFSQWAGSEQQKEGAETIRQVSQRYWQLSESEAQLSEEDKKTLKDARELILEGETSCFLFWGDDWVPKLYERTEPALTLLNKLQGSLNS